MSQEKIISHYFLNTADHQRIPVECHGRGGPKLLIGSNLHGNEWFTGVVLGETLNQLDTRGFDQLSPNVRLLNMHPNAVRNRTRTYHHVDVNRSFPHEIHNPNRRRVPIVATLSEEIVGYSDLQLAVFFHGNLTDNGAPPQPFYFYDVTARNDSPTQQHFLTLRDHLISDVKADPRYRGLNGEYKSNIYDGQDEQGLQNTVVNGYVRQIAQTENDGSVEMFIASLALTDKLKRFDRALVFEIPSLLPFEDQQRLVQLIFDTMIIPYLNFLKLRES